MKLRSLAAVSAALMATGSAHAATDDSCEPVGDMVPVCDFNQPEDMEVLPGGEEIIVSEMSFVWGERGTMTYSPGRLSLYDVAADKRRTLYPGLFMPETQHNVWGDPSCKSIGAELSPHGVSLSRRKDGTQQLLVVNHGGDRVSVEFFEVTGKGADTGLQWRGCVDFPDSININDVAATPGGGFVVTAIVFGGSGGFMDAMAKVKQGLNTGFVLRWHPGTGYEPVRGSVAALPNGILVSPDGSTAFIAPHADEGEVRKFDLATGEVLGEAKVPGGDNMSWGNDGRILVGTGPHAQPGETCDPDPEYPVCGSTVRITAVDPETMDTEIVLERDKAPIAAISIVVDTGDGYVFGTPLGKNLLKVPAE